MAELRHNAALLPGAFHESPDSYVRSRTFSASDLDFSPGAASLCGRLEGRVGHGRCQSEVRIELRIEGDVVTGPILGPAGEMFMQPGKVTPRGVSFTSGPLNPQDRDVPLVWTGQATDENTLTFVVTAEDLEGPTFELTVTRDTARR